VTLGNAKTHKNTETHQSTQTTEIYRSAGNLSRTPTKKGVFFLPRTSPSHLPKNCRQYTGNSPEKYRQNVAQVDSV